MQNTELKGFTPEELVVGKCEPSDSGSTRAYLYHNGRRVGERYEYKYQNGNTFTEYNIYFTKGSPETLPKPETCQYCGGDVGYFVDEKYSDEYPVGASRKLQQHSDECCREGA